MTQDKFCRDCRAPLDLKSEEKRTRCYVCEAIKQAEMRATLIEGVVRRMVNGEGFCYDKLSKENRDKLKKEYHEKWFGL